MKLVVLFDYLAVGGGVKNCVPPPSPPPSNIVPRHVGVVRRSNYSGRLIEEFASDECVSGKLAVGGGSKNLTPSSSSSTSCIVPAGIK